MTSAAGSSPALAQNTTQGSEPKFEMGTFYLVMLVKGPKSGPDQPAQPGVIQAHLKHLSGLIEAGKALLAGPFMDGGRINGLVVMTVSSAEEARKLAEEDPAVKSGLFGVEVLKWWAAKGIMKPAATPLNPAALTRYYFGLIRRGPAWTPESTPETQKLQEAHLANIRALAATGKLVIAGPFEDGGDNRGVFVFKVDSIDEAKALSDSDPAVKAGRLVVEVHPWLVPKGSLP
jgi:uncharacterized protein YciI